MHHIDHPLYTRFGGAEINLFLGGYKALKPRVLLLKLLSFNQQLGCNGISIQRPRLQQPKEFALRYPVKSPLLRKAVLLGYLGRFYWIIFLERGSRRPWLDFLHPSSCPLEWHGMLNRSPGASASCPNISADLQSSPALSNRWSANFLRYARGFSISVSVRLKGGY